MKPLSSAAVNQSVPVVPPGADWMVLILLLSTLLLAWVLREQTLYATEEISVQELRLAIPTGSIPLTADDPLAVTTRDGLTLRVSVLPLPAEGKENPASLTAGRAFTQAKSYDLYRPLQTQIVHAAGEPAGSLEYVYVYAGKNDFYSSPLQIIHGLELLLARGEQCYVLTLEGPETRWDEVQVLWPRIVHSLRFAEQKK